jgi:hypothetical protein
MGTIALKLTLTPVLILAASLAGRRWGQTVGGWLVALPLTTGPVTFFLALEQGTGFAARAAEGALAGAAAEACFCLAFGAAAGRSAAIAFLAGSLAFIAAGIPIGATRLGLALSAALTIASLILGLWLMPRRAFAGIAPVRLPAWDLPARMAVATTLVIGITSAAPLLGPRLSGLIATFPVFGAVLGIFAMGQQGAAAARQVMRGVLAGLFSFAAFFLALGLGIERLGIALGFIAAGLLAVAVQICSLTALRRAGFVARGVVR